MTSLFKTSYSTDVKTELTRAHAALDAAGITRFYDGRESTLAERINLLAAERAAKADPAPARQAGRLETAAARAVFIAMLRLKRVGGVCPFCQAEGKHESGCHGVKVVSLYRTVKNEPLR